MTTDKNNLAKKLDNLTLKQWLRDVGPVRRREVLAKIKEDLESLGLPKTKLRHGLRHSLLQLMTECSVIVEKLPLSSISGYSQKSQSTSPNCKMESSESDSEDEVVCISENYTSPRKSKSAGEKSTFAADVSSSTERTFISSNDSHLSSEKSDIGKLHVLRKKNHSSNKSSNQDKLHSTETIEMNLKLPSKNLSLSTLNQNLVPKNISPKTPSVEKKSPKGTNDQKCKLSPGLKSQNCIKNRSVFQSSEKNREDFEGKNDLFSKNVCLIDKNSSSQFTKKHGGESTSSAKKVDCSVDMPIIIEEFVKPRKGNLHNRSCTVDNSCTTSKKKPSKERKSYSTDENHGSRTAKENSRDESSPYALKIDRSSKIPTIEQELVKTREANHNKHSSIDIFASSPKNNPSKDRKSFSTDEITSRIVDSSAEKSSSSKNSGCENVFSVHKNHGSHREKKNKDKCSPSAIKIDRSSKIATTHQELVKTIEANHNKHSFVDIFASSPNNNPSKERKSFSTDETTSRNADFFADKSSSSKKSGCENVFSINKNHGSHGEKKDKDKSSPSAIKIDRSSKIATTHQKLVKIREANYNKRSSVDNFSSTPNNNPSKERGSFSTDETTSRIVDSSAEKSSSSKNSGCENVFSVNKNHGSHGKKKDKDKSSPSAIKIDRSSKIATIHQELVKTIEANHNKHSSVDIFASSSNNNPSKEGRSFSTDETSSRNADSSADKSSSSTKSGCENVFSINKNHGSHREKKDKDKSSPSAIKIDRSSKIPTIHQELVKTIEANLNKDSFVDIFASSPNNNPSKERKSFFTDETTSRNADSSAEKSSSSKKSGCENVFSINKNHGSHGEKKDKDKSSPSAIKIDRSSKIPTIEQGLVKTREAIHNNSRYSLDNFFSKKNSSKERRSTFENTSRTSDSSEKNSSSRESGSNNVFSIDKNHSLQIKKDIKDESPSPAKKINRSSKIPTTQKELVKPKEANHHSRHYTEDNFSSTPKKNPSIERKSFSTDETTSRNADSFAEKSSSSKKSGCENVFSINKNHGSHGEKKDKDKSYPSAIKIDRSSKIPTTQKELVKPRETNPLNRRHTVDNFFSTPNNNPSKERRSFSTDEKASRNSNSYEKKNSSSNDVFSADKNHNSHIRNQHSKDKSPSSEKKKNHSSKIPSIQKAYVESSEEKHQTPHFSADNPSKNKSSEVQRSSKNHSSPENHRKESSKDKSSSAKKSHHSEKISSSPKGLVKSSKENLRRSSDHDFSTSKNNPCKVQRSSSSKENISQNSDSSEKQNLIKIFNNEENEHKSKSKKASCDKLSFLSESFNEKSSASKKSKCDSETEIANLKEKTKDVKLNTAKNNEEPTSKVISKKEKSKNFDIHETKIKGRKLEESIPSMKKKKKRGQRKSLASIFKELFGSEGEEDQEMINVYNQKRKKMDFQDSCYSGTYGSEASPMSNVAYTNELNPLKISSPDSTKKECEKETNSDCPTEAPSSSVSHSTERIIIYIKEEAYQEDDVSVQQKEIPVSSQNILLETKKKTTEVALQDSSTCSLEEKKKSDQESEKIRSETVSEKAQNLFENSTGLSDDISKTEVVRNKESNSYVFTTDDINIILNILDADSPIPENKAVETSFLLPQCQPEKTQSNEDEIQEVAESGKEIPLVQVDDDVDKIQKDVEKGSTVSDSDGTDSIQAAKDFPIQAKEIPPVPPKETPNVPIGEKTLEEIPQVQTESIPTDAMQELPISQSVESFTPRLRVKGPSELGCPEWCLSPCLPSNPDPQEVPSTQFALRNSEANANYVPQTELISHSEKAVRRSPERKVCYRSASGRPLPPPYSETAFSNSNSNPHSNNFLATSSGVVNEATLAAEKLVTLINPMAVPYSSPQLTIYYNDLISILGDISNDTIKLRNLYRNRPLGLCSPDLKGSNISLNLKLQNLAKFLQVAFEEITVQFILENYHQLSSAPVLNCEELNYIMSIQYSDVSLNRPQLHPLHDQRYLPMSNPIPGSQMRFPSSTASNNGETLQRSQCRFSGFNPQINAGGIPAMQNFNSSQLDTYQRTQQQMPVSQPSQTYGSQRTQQYMMVSQPSEIYANQRTQQQMPVSQPSQTYGSQRTQQYMMVSQPSEIYANQRTQQQMPVFQILQMSASQMNQQRMPVSQTSQIFANQRTQQQMPVSQPSQIYANQRTQQQMSVSQLSQMRASQRAQQQMLVSQPTQIYTNQQIDTIQRTQQQMLVSQPPQMYTNQRAQPTQIYTNQQINASQRSQQQMLVSQPPQMYTNQRAQPTQLDTIQRFQQQMPVSQPTQMDTSQRIQQQMPVSQPTQMDTSQRIEQQTSVSQPTQIGTSQVNHQLLLVPQPTQIDTSLRSQQQMPVSQPTEMDTSQRIQQQIPVSQATQIDTHHGAQQQTPVSQPSQTDNSPKTCSTMFSDAQLMLLQNQINAHNVLTSNTTKLLGNKNDSLQQTSEEISTPETNSILTPINQNTIQVQVSEKSKKNILDQGRVPSPNSTLVFRKKKTKFPVLKAPIPAKIRKKYTKNKDGSNLSISTTPSTSAALKRQRTSKQTEINSTTANLETSISDSKTNSTSESKLRKLNPKTNAATVPTFPEPIAIPTVTQTTTPPVITTSTNPTTTSPIAFSTILSPTKSSTFAESIASSKTNRSIVFPKTMSTESPITVSSSTITLRTENVVITSITINPTTSLSTTSQITMSSNPTSSASYVKKHIPVTAVKYHRSASIPLKRKSKVPRSKYTAPTQTKNLISNKTSKNVTVAASVANSIQKNIVERQINDETSDSKLKKKGYLSMPSLSHVPDSEEPQATPTKTPLLTKRKKKSSQSKVSGKQQISRQGSSNSQKLDISVENSTEEEEPCLRCKEKSTVACARCEGAFYCDKLCQEKHWEEVHYETCIPKEADSSELTE